MEVMDGTEGWLGMEGWGSADIWRSAYRGIYILHMLKTEPVVDVVLSLFKYSEHTSVNQNMCYF